MKRPPGDKASPPEHARLNFDRMTMRPRHLGDQAKPQTKAPGRCPRETLKGLEDPRIALRRDPLSIVIDAELQKLSSSGVFPLHQRELNMESSHCVANCVA